MPKSGSQLAIVDWTPGVCEGLDAVEDSSGLGTAAAAFAEVGQAFSPAVATASADTSDCAFLHLNTSSLRSWTVRDPGRRTAPAEAGSPTPRAGAGPAYQVPEGPSRRRQQPRSPL